MSDTEDPTLERSISAPEPGEYADDTHSTHSTDPSLQSEPVSPAFGPNLVPNILSQPFFSLDSFLSQSLEEELTDLPAIASQMYQNLRSDFKKTKHQLRHHVGTTEQRIRRKMDKTTNNIKSQVDVAILKWERNMKKASVVRLMDKIAFTLGMFECCCTPWLVSQYPEWIPFVHTTQSIILIGVRYFLYKRKSWHFFLLDMCYFVNVFVILYLYVFPQSQALFGAICLDKVTSVYIHMSPPITLYVVRWLYPDPEHTRFPAMKGMDVLPTLSSLKSAIALYLTWQIAYYVFVVVRQREKIKAGKRVTSYTWLLSDPKGGAISKAAHRFGEKYSIVTFMGMQLIYTFVTCLFGLLLYRSFKLNTIFLVGLFNVSAWNGACYYMEVFGKVYEKQMSKLAAEVSSAVTANQSTQEQDHEEESHVKDDTGDKSETDKKNE
ncbi:hypothetical protein BGX34_006631 [Mortierella sp. NVP85]|nr:hypothetical protein BGX34_006631 [Mortierella sp. NVP85]